MKRSKSLRLVLMGGAALTLGACDQPVEVGVFETVEQCTVMGYSQSSCESAIEDARKEHVKAAPKYASRADCEAEFGRCEPGPTASQQLPQGQQNPQGPQGEQSAFGGGSFFMPLLAGYMMGQMMGGNRYAGQPLYRPRAGAAGGTGLYTGAGTQVAAKPGLARMPQSAFTNAAAGSSTLQRGGFGARARSVSVAS
jgi:uncharacterized protein YgiB involved in biofilm formation